MCGLHLIHFISFRWVIWKSFNWSSRIFLRPIDGQNFLRAFYREFSKIRERTQFCGFACTRRLVRFFWNAAAGLGTLSRDRRFPRFHACARMQSLFLPRRFYYSRGNWTLIKNGDFRKPTYIHNRFIMLYPLRGAKIFRTITSSFKMSSLVNIKSKGHVEPKIFKN